LSAFESYNNFNLEVVFIDGKSTDNTIKKILSYKREFLSNNIKFNLISEKDKGLYDAMNKGVKNSNFNWIWFLNSDDYLMKDAFKKIFQGNTSISAFDVIYGALLKKGDLTEYIVRERNFKSGLKNVTFNHPATLVKRDVFETFGGFDTKYRWCSDYDFFTRINQGNVSRIYIDEILTVMREGGISDRLSTYFSRGIEHYRIDKKNYNLKTAITNNFSYFFVGLPKKIIKDILLASNLSRLVQFFYTTKYSK
jgi:glycosyltransferase involved in cell wall biosynthesis